MWLDWWWGDGSTETGCSFFNKKYIDFILLQRTRLTTEYNITRESDESDIVNALNKMVQKDLELIEPYLPQDSENPFNILDIGCGLSTIDIVLSEKYSKSHFFLQDKSEDI
jgi:hypothetical protein